MNISFNWRRKIVANVTSKSWMNIPHVSYIYEADVTDLIDEYKKLNGKKHENHVTFNILLIRIIIEGIKAAPKVNSHIFFNKWLASGAIETFDIIDVNMPILLENNEVLTLKLSDLGNKTLQEMQTCLNQLTAKLYKTDIDVVLRRVGFEDTLKQLKSFHIIHSLGRILGLFFGKHKTRKITREEEKKYKRMPEEEKIIQDEVNMGTVTISNMGAVVRGTKGMPSLIEIVPPQIFACGIGPLQEIPVVVNEDNLKINIRAPLETPFTRQKKMIKYKHETERIF